MGSVGHRLQVQFVSSTGDNFYEEGLTDVEAAEFKDSFTDIYTHSSLQVPWYAGEARGLTTPVMRTSSSCLVPRVQCISGLPCPN